MKKEKQKLRLKILILFKMIYKGINFTAKAITNKKNKNNQS
jgi:hypothetical protein